MSKANSSSASFHLCNLRKSVDEDGSRSIYDSSTENADYTDEKRTVTEAPYSLDPSKSVRILLLH